jgi:uroporphyrinogen decarboxylase
MNRREVVHQVLKGKRPPYVPWSYSFTEEAEETLQAHFGSRDL